MAIHMGAPVGVILLQKCCRLGKYRKTVYQASVLFLTFIAYTALHMSRRPLAVVKNSLSRDCNRLVPPPGLEITDENRHNWCSWPPFDGKDANRLLGILDSVFVFAYAACMFLSGMIAERIDLRYYLALGMVFSGIFTYMFGLAYYLDIHSFAYFVIVQILAGAVQCTGWPGVVACVGNWFGKARRGLIFGIWNAHLYTGNILGAYVAGYFVVHNWGLSFIVPGIIVGAVGFLLFLFLVPHPENVGCEADVHDLPDVSSDIDGDLEEKSKLPIKGTTSKFSVSSNGLPSALNGSFINEKTKLTEDPNSNVSYTSVNSNSRKKAITFWGALKIPGVVEFSMCLFFSKLVSYTFLFWLPRYLDHTTGIGSQQSAYLSIAFDVGGIIGGILAGLISDHTGSSAMTCVGFLGLAIPMLFIYEAYGNISYIANIALQVICGALVNGPYALITTAVSAELGTHPTIKKNSKALSTVTAIIDGTGSVGAAVGPFLAGMLSDMSWVYVFYMMMAADFLALLALLRPSYKELKKLCEQNERWLYIRQWSNRGIYCCKNNSAYQEI